MKRVLLVDDEIFVRRGLLTLIDWKTLGLTVLGEVSDGEDALKMILEHNPEIVITDIRMPVLNGLELIERVKEHSHIQSNFIIISGYDDFKYAQKAMRFGVHDFVLKPIEKVEMEDAISRLIHKINEQYSAELSWNGLYQSLINEREYVPQTKEQKQILHVGRSKYYCYLTIECNQLTLHLKGENTLKNLIIDTLNKLLSIQKNYPLFKLHGQQYGIILNSFDIEQSNCTLDQLIERFYAKLTTNLNDEIMIYLGQQVAAIEQLYISYMTAKYSEQFKYTGKYGNVIKYTEVKSKKVQYIQIKNKDYFLLMEQIDNNNRERLKEVIDDIFNQFTEDLYSPESVKTSINRCIHGVFDTIRSLDSDETMLTEYINITEWEEKNIHFQQIKTTFLHFCLDAAAFIVNLRRNVAKGDIYLIKKYIDRNFHKNISLKSIGNEFFMNPVYLGQIFKKTFGRYFKDYLLELRMTQAKKLLRQTQKRIYEIAEDVGFNSADYFMNQFEKKEKMSPTEYRNYYSTQHIEEK